VVGALVLRLFGLSFFASLLIGAVYAQQTELSSGATNFPPECGTERWSVKTLSDDEAEMLDLSEIKHQSVEELNSLPEHCGGAANRRTWNEERAVYSTEGIVKAVRMEKDRDVHLVLVDPDHREFSLVAEVVDPACSGAADSPHLRVLERARRDLSALLRSGRTDDPRPLLGRRVRVEGVGFFDFDHGQAGRSRNCFELHPVLSIAPADD